MEYDASLVKIVHQENRHGYSICSILTRFGGLFVCVYDKEGEYCYSCDNVLEARDWIDTLVEKYDGMAEEAELLAMFG